QQQQQQRVGHFEGTAVIDLAATAAGITPGGHQAASTADDASQVRDELAASLEPTHHLSRRSVGSDGNDGNDRSGSLDIGGNLDLFALLGRFCQDPDIVMGSRYAPQQKATGVCAEKHRERGSDEQQWSPSSSVSASSPSSSSSAESAGLEVENLLLRAQIEDLTLAIRALSVIFSSDIQPMFDL
ncbi:hypothetical protein EV182_003404, partial [Spiromyces aspiralis]